MASAVSSENTPPSRESTRPTADSSLWRRRLDVAVIGAGAAGLAAARELMREGHAVTVIEAGGEIGGVWAYDERIETEDLLGLDPNRQQVHSSMYASLRTNLPRELMGYLDFPFSAPLPGDCPDADVDSRDGNSADSRQDDADLRRFPSHREVLRYLRRYAERFGISNRVELHTRVISAVPVISRQAAVEESGEGGRNGGGGGEGRNGAEARKEGKSGQVVGNAGNAHGEGEGWELLEASAEGTEAPVVRWRLKIARSRPHRSISTGGGSLGGLAGAAAGVGDGERVEGREEEEEEREFDALVVCNGHYSQPKIATIAGVGTWPGIQIHSHNYRHPEGFAGKVVVVVGAEASGQDIARELAAVAREVHICARGWRSSPAAAGAATGAIETGYFEDLRGRVQQHPMIKQANPDGKVEFEDGFACHADVIMHCTGYHYSFPFLALPPSLLSVDTGRVTPLFRHVLPPALAPSLSFIGLPWKVVPFPLCQLQARWVAQLLSGQLPVPPRSDMEGGVRRLYARMEAQGVPERYVHRLDMEQVWPGAAGARAAQVRYGGRRASYGLEQQVPVPPGSDMEGGVRRLYARMEAQGVPERYVHRLDMEQVWPGAAGARAAQVRYGGRRASSVCAHGGAGRAREICSQAGHGTGMAWSSRCPCRPGPIWRAACVVCMRAWRRRACQRDMFTGWTWNRYGLEQQVPVPRRSDMEGGVRRLYARMEAQGVPERYVHRLDMEQVWPVAAGARAAQVWPGAAAARAAQVRYGGRRASSVCAHGGAGRAREICSQAGHGTGMAWSSSCPCRPGPIWRAACVVCMRAWRRRACQRDMFTGWTWNRYGLEQQVPVPPRSDMEGGVRRLYARMEEQGVPERYVHRLDMEQVWPGAAAARAAQVRYGGRRASSVCAHGGAGRAREICSQAGHGTGMAWSSSCPCRPGPIWRAACVVCMRAWRRRACQRDMFTGWTWNRYGLEQQVPVPPRSDMEGGVRSLYARMEAQGVPERYVHRLDMEQVWPGAAGARAAQVRYGGRRASSVCAHGGAGRAREICSQAGHGTGMAWSSSCPCRPGPIWRAACVVCMRAWRRRACQRDMFTGWTWNRYGLEQQVPVPPRSDMEGGVRRLYARMEAQGVPERYVHRLDMEQVWPGAAGARAAQVRYGGRRASSVCAHGGAGPIWRAACVVCMRAWRRRACQRDMFTGWTWNRYGLEQQVPVPRRSDMEGGVRRLYARMEAQGVPERYVHRLDMEQVWPGAAGARAAQVRYGGRRASSVCAHGGAGRAREICSQAGHGTGMAWSSRCPCRPGPIWRAACVVCMRAWRSRACQRDMFTGWTWNRYGLEQQLPVPPRSDMEGGVRRLYARMEAQGVPERYVHRLDMEQVWPGAAGARAAQVRYGGRRASSVCAHGGAGRASEIHPQAGYGAGATWER
ncbi:unnamed protein product [Closterium sp. Yama58-4]|nr:unnamed protein product [Closterium sp. Yama58-4]